MCIALPACACFDAYPNFEERGRHFKRAVKGLEGEYDDCGYEFQAFGRHRISRRRQAVGEARKLLEDLGNAK